MAKLDANSVAITAARGRPGLAGLSDAHALLLAHAYRWLELHQITGWHLPRPPSITMPQAKVEEAHALARERNRVAVELEKQAASAIQTMRQNHLRQALLNLVRLTDVRYQREGRDAFQPFIDALREVEVALTHGKPTRKRQDTTRKLTLQTAHEVLAKWEREKAARPNEGKAIAAEWVPYMKELGYEQKIRQGPYPALRYLLRHARQVLDRGD